MSRASVISDGRNRGSEITIVLALALKDGRGEDIGEEALEMGVALETRVVDRAAEAEAEVAGYMHFSFRSLHALHVGLVSSHLDHALVF